MNRYYNRLPKETRTVEFDDLQLPTGGFVAFDAEVELCFDEDLVMVRNVVIGEHSRYTERLGDDNTPLIDADLVAMDTAARELAVDLYIL